MTTRSETRAIMVNDLQIGHQNKVIIQSMCNTKTSDIEATVKQTGFRHFHNPTQ